MNVRETEMELRRVNRRCEIESGRYGYTYWHERRTQLLRDVRRWRNLTARENRLVDGGKSNLF